MKCTIPEISWHNREPVLSVDVHPVSDGFYKLASGGGDSHILIWQMVLFENGSVKQEVVSDLTRHQKSVNTVRWSSTGHYLASADDDANIIVWQLKTDNVPLLEGDTDDKEVWIVYKILRGHKEDIYDLCWSTNNLKLLSGSVDNTAIIWDLTKGKLDQIMTDHKGFVQGVAWDPKNQLIATISTDRVCRVFDNTGRQVKARIHKGKLPVSAEHSLYDKESKYYHDDTFKSFFRRLQFTPDGSLLIVPSGHFQVDEKILNSTLIFTLDNWTEPVAVLPLEKQSSTVVRCCPLLFQLREDGPEPLVKLPYRMIFAVGTDHDIILYDTQQIKPFARFHEIHYTRITDLTWSRDGLLLVASSTDGYCSLITFDPKELGAEYVKEESDEETNIMDVSDVVEANEKDENVDITNKNAKEKEEVKKRPSFIAQWVQNTPKKSKIEKNNDIIEIPDDDDLENNQEEATPKKMKKNSKTNESIDTEGEEKDKPGELPKQIKEQINKLIPRRITPKKIGECSKSNTLAKPIEVRRKPRVFEENNLVDKSTEVKEVEDKPKNRNRLINTNKEESEDKNKEISIDNESSKINNNIVNEIDLQTKMKPCLVHLRRLEDTELDINRQGNVGLRHEPYNKTSVNEENKNKDSGNGNNETKSNINEHVGSLNIGTTNKNGRKKTNTLKIGKDILTIKPKQTNTPPKNTELIKSTSTSTPVENNSSKKKCNSKVKIGSLVRKKLNVTPVKSNSLLDFLKKSGENSKKNKPTSRVKENIDLTCEDEAQDCFSKETVQNGKSSPDAIPLEEDCTEDFCLQLEDTQEEKIIQKSCEAIEIDKDIESHREASRVIEISDNSCSPKKKKIEENVKQKMPRRVPLITLSSPKGKKTSTMEPTEKDKV